MNEDPNIRWTPEYRLQRAAEFDAMADQAVAKLAEGGMTEREMRTWLRGRAWAAKLRGAMFTAEMATAELVTLGLPL